jgi:hypothetical protein
MGLLGDEHEELKSFMLMYWPSIRITTWSEQLSRWRAAGACADHERAQCQV